VHRSRLTGMRTANHRDLLAFNRLTIRGLVHTLLGGVVRTSMAINPAATILRIDATSLDRTRVHVPAADDREGHGVGSGSRPRRPTPLRA
jgi:hypothetical protein